MLFVASIHKTVRLVHYDEKMQHYVLWRQLFWAGALRDFNQQVFKAKKEKEGKIRFLSSPSERGFFLVLTFLISSRSLVVTISEVMQGGSSRRGRWLPVNRPHVTALQTWTGSAVRAGELFRAQTRDVWHTSVCWADVWKPQSYGMHFYILILKETK